MKKVCLFFVALLCPGFAVAQFTTITASHLNVGGQPIPSGMVTFTPEDAKGNPIPFAQSGGGLNSPTAYPCSINNGAIAGSCSIPDSALTTPANICYSVTISKTTAPSRSYTLPKVCGITGSTWALDTYGPPAQTTAVQPLQISAGIGAPHTPMLKPSIYLRYDNGGQLYISGNDGTPVLVTGNASVTSSAMQSAVSSLTGCGTSGNAWNPATNSCTPAGTGPQGPTGATGATGPPGSTSDGASGASQSSDGNGGLVDNGCTAVSGTSHCKAYVADGTTQGIDALGVGTGSIPGTLPTNFAGWIGPPTGTPSYLAYLPNINPSAAGLMILNPVSTVNGVSQAPVTTTAGTTDQVLRGDLTFGTLTPAQVIEGFNSGTCSGTLNSDGTCSHQSGVADSITLLPGTAPGSQPANSFRWLAPTAIATGFSLTVPTTLPPDSSHTVLICTTSGICSWGALSGGPAGLSVVSSTLVNTNSGGFTSPAYSTSSNCGGGGGCGSAAAGTFVISAGTTTATVTTTAVHTNSEIFMNFNTTGGCSTTPTNLNSLLPAYKSAIVDATSFTATVPVAPAGSFLCVDYFIVN